MNFLGLVLVGAIATLTNAVALPNPEVGQSATLNTRCVAGMLSHFLTDILEIDTLTLLSNT